VDIITYSLREGQAKSDRYYQDIAAFADEVLGEAERRSRPHVEAFQAYLAGNCHEIARTLAEHEFEFLTLGVLWRVYGGRAMGLAQGPRRTLASLARLRQQVRVLKPVIDWLRGVLSTLFLGIDRHLRWSERPALLHFDRLLGWLEATGDFEEEVTRLAPWRDFLKTVPDDASTILANAVELATWFERGSEAALGRYTVNVEDFLTRVHPNYHWREDNIFCGRQRVEYHLNMVGTEILNRAFRETFLASARKLVVVPPCMRAKPADKCLAKITSFGARCAGCTPGCRVHQLTKLGEKYGFGVAILPDDLRVFSIKSTGLNTSGGSIGIVGVSCALTNAPGGWKTRRMGIPAQGVLLDYCGCSWHWHEEGIPTDINFNQLLDVLGIQKKAARPAPDEASMEPVSALNRSLDDANKIDAASGLPAASDGDQMSIVRSCAGYCDGLSVGVTSMTCDC